MHIKTFTHRQHTPAPLAPRTHSRSFSLSLLSPYLSLHSGRAQAAARGEEGESSGAFLPHNDIPALIALRPRSVCARRRQSSRSHIIYIFSLASLAYGGGVGGKKTKHSFSRRLRSRMTCFSSNASRLALAQMRDSDYRKRVE
jgi:hypothetical protein